MRALAPSVRRVRIAFGSASAPPSRAAARCEPGGGRLPETIEVRA